LGIWSMCVTETDKFFPCSATRCPTLVLFVAVSGLRDASSPYTPERAWQQECRSPETSTSRGPTLVLLVAVSGLRCLLTLHTGAGLASRKVEVRRLRPAEGQADDCPIDD
jgi:hypothetical protein